MLRQQAIRWLRRAGELAMSRFELEDAAVLFGQAIDLRPELAEEVDLWRFLGRAAALRYDGGGLWDAMQRAIERCEDHQVLGELYAELAFETTGRAGMWTQFPDRALVQGWIWAKSPFSHGVPREENPVTSRSRWCCKNP